jgi:hypothetical protein
MKITEMIKQLGGNRAAIAEKAGISVFQLNNMVSKGQEVELLPDGSFVAVRSNAVRFNNA